MDDIFLVNLFTKSFLIRFHIKQKNIIYILIIFNQELLLTQLPPFTVIGPVAFVTTFKFVIGPREVLLIDIEAVYAGVIRLRSYIS